MIQPVLVLLFKHQKWHEGMIIDGGDPTSREANRDICQVFVEFGMGGLDDSETNARELKIMRYYIFSW